MRLDVFDAVLVLPSPADNRLAHNFCLIIEFGVGISKSPLTNRRLYRPQLGGIVLFPAF